MFSGKSIICFGGEDWWYHHPHSKNHLMKRFARSGNKVIFVNSISMGLPSLAHKDLLPRVHRKLKSYAKWARETAEGITVVSPPVLPFFGNAMVRAANKRLLKLQIARLAKKCGMEKPILWIAIPTAVEMIGALDESLVIYQVSDKYDANMMDHATDPAHIRKLHERALERADIIFYSGRKLFEEAGKATTEAANSRGRSYLLEQAVDFEHFSRAGEADAEVAPEVAEIASPRIGYFGAIEPWLVDQKLIRQAARERSAWQWVFIGNKSRGFEIEELPNTHFLPPVSYEDLPRYAAGFDVCVLPWDIENVFTSYGSAIKVREYLATGKPVVISPLPEYEPMADVIRIARSRDEFIKLIDDALNETGVEGEHKREQRQASVKENTWDARAEWVSQLIEQHLQRKLD